MCPLRGQRARHDSHPTQIPKDLRPSLWANWGPGWGARAGPPGSCLPREPRDQLKAGAVLSGHRKRVKEHQYRNGSKGSPVLLLDAQGTSPQIATWTGLLATPRVPPSTVRASRAGAVVTLPFNLPKDGLLAAQGQSPRFPCC